MVARKDCAHFIPVLLPELLQVCQADPGVRAEDREKLGQLAERIGQVHHQHAHRGLVELKNAYAPFDPDSDATQVHPIAAQEKQRRLNDLIRDFAWLLDRAHFQHLSREEIEPMLNNSSDWGISMQVDFSVFEHCAIFARGESHELRTLCSWRTRYRELEVEVPIFRRLVLILKLRPHPRLGPGVRTDHVYLKLFKDIPRADVDMLLPGARVKLRLFDRGKIGFGFLSGLGTMIFRVFEDLMKWVQMAATPRESILWGLLAGTLGYGYKSYYDYRTTQQAYHLTLTQSLYFQCLDSNAGVLTRVYDEAEEQQTRTALLAYFCLWRFAGPEGFTAEELEAAMGVYLDRYTGVAVVCAPGEPAAQLVRLGLAKAGEGRYQAVALAEAVK